MVMIRLGGKRLDQRDLYTDLCNFTIVDYALEQVAPIVTIEPQRIRTLHG